LSRTQVIVQPGTSRFVRACTTPEDFTRAGVVVALVFLGTLIAGIGLLASGVLGLQIVGGILAALGPVAVVGGAIRGAQRSVRSTSWDYKGQPIVGEARQLLGDAMQAAADAEDFVAEIPTSVDWAQFRPDVEALLWDAAGHAAEVSKTNAQLKTYRYAEPGTAQHEVWSELSDRRAAHLAVVAEARDRMIEFTAAAGNAAAAARVALERTGSVQELEGVSPSAAKIIAEGGLSEAKEQLELLGEAWGELDTSLTGLKADLDRDVATRSGKPRRRGRRSPPPTDRQQEG
jgi:hypothetical protein